MKSSSDFARFLRLARAMSRHISGEPDAMRVVSRKPLAQSCDCAFGRAGSRTQFASAAATTCGRWLERLTSKSCCSGASRSVRAPSDFQNCSTLRTAAGLEFLRRRHDANRVHKQIRLRRPHARFFPAGHRMTADEMRAGLSDEAADSIRARPALTLPTSVTIAPRFKAGSISSTRARICASGVQRMTRSAFETAASRSVVA